MEYMIRIGIEGLNRVLENKRFTVSKKVQQELREYEENNNPLLLYLTEDPHVQDEPTSKVYRNYTEFCLTNGFQPVSNIEFSKQVKKQLHMDITLRRIRGKQYRVFTRRDEDD